MASIQIIQASDRPDIQAVTPLDLSLDLFFNPDTVNDETIALARTVMVALGTDRLALPDDTLPIPSDIDRRGWWGDLDQQEIWSGPEWSIGWRGWLLERAKITDANAIGGATIAILRGYISEALQPFVDWKICSQFDIELAQTGVNQITGKITMYRGPKVLIALQYQDLWTDIQA